MTDARSARKPGHDDPENTIAWGPETAALIRRITTANAANDAPFKVLRPRVAAESGLMVGVAVATAALAPFLQSLVSALGTRVGERLDDATRARLGRLLRRQIPAQSDRGSMFLLSGSERTRIQIDIDMPPEALRLLPGMDLEGLEEGSDIPALLRWTPAGWLATVSRSHQLEDLLWNAERGAWTPTAVPTLPPGPAPQPLT
ncbi:hypothetical protein ACFV06_26820 [Streptomyces sp. NPDC059618]|uniref:hypothetical protein n=1 Tax=Streptomyces sp. NPDC059618 TaxID=3346887 RepID=UPI0036C2EB95